MKVTVHNLTDWNLSEKELNVLITLSKEKMKECDDKICEVFYGILAGKLIIMKNEQN